ncbi:hypothetical protein OESDEN_01882 [Oesophagostomum dentatum]|uniref:Uncharacterized protein n=1 Tax=Oesophagostomum dentatum TaxID=61180 RepID=A0A0B1TLQ1_OESDE|nr:hypothetical protein OESDEN_01882 [Oesophagostomum dentatum]
MHASLHLEKIASFANMCFSCEKVMLQLESDEMDKNASLQKELRDLSEKQEELQRRYNQDTALLERTIQDLKKSSQEKHEADAKKLSDVQAELGYFQERTRSITQKHAEELGHLESAHLAESNQKDAQLGSARDRIKMLEDKLSEHERSIREHRKDFACLSTAKNALEAEHAKIVEELKKKEEDLKDATETLEQSWADIESKFPCFPRDPPLFQLSEMSAAKDNVLCEVNRLKKELTTKEECLCKRNVEAEEEKTQLSSRISELEEDLMAERSIKQALEGQLFKCHEEIAAKNTELNAKMDQLEHLDEELKVLQTDKAVAEDECKELREKDAVRSVQLGELTDRTRLIEEAYCHVQRKEQQTRS